jgi:hypothetical protein
MGILNHSIRVSFSFRPFAALARMMVLSLLALTACTPTTMGHLPPPPIVISQAEILKNGQIDFVQSELEVRLRNNKHDHRKIAETIVTEATSAGLDPLFVLAVIEAESNYDVEACSSSKAKGLMQILPSTFRALKATGSIFDPVDNVRAGTRFLSLLTKSFKRPESVLMAYNGGPGAAGKHLKAIAAGQESDGSWEMQNYPVKVMANYKRLLVKTGHKPEQASKLFKVPSRPIALASR